MVVDPTEKGAETSAEAQSKKAAKKQAKDAAKAAKKAEHRAAAGKQEDVQEESEDYSAGKYGQPVMIQSAEKFPDRSFVDVSQLIRSVDMEPVWVRGRVHTSRSKGKQCFLILRLHRDTVQCVIAVNDVVSKQMVKFSG
uniref:Aspartyl-tRNA synthetase n=1 Tax=Phlebotomus papatasi TaxID=29031 RepID=A0A1B0D2J7_PHLPP